VLSLAATATRHPALSAAALALIILALTLVTFGYLLTCWLWPFATCRRCGGTGKRRAPRLFGRGTFGLCRRCHGDGHRLRLGRHLINYLRDTHRDGTRSHDGGR
jgi:hypothetical protein